MAVLRDLLDRLARSPEDVRAENCRHWASGIAGTTRIKDVEARQRCKVAGVITNVRIEPREGWGAVEATITDGTGELVAKWLGRPSMSGIRLGMGLVVEGTLGAGPDGKLVVLNPEYRLTPGPEHG